MVGGGALYVNVKLFTVNVPDPLIVTLPVFAVFTYRPLIELVPLAMVSCAGEAAAVQPLSRKKLAPFVPDNV